MTVSSAAREAVQMAENETLLALRQLRKSNQLGKCQERVKTLDLVEAQMCVSAELITSAIAELAKEEKLLRSASEPMVKNFI
jgi:hypothetical protein